MSAWLPDAGACPDSPALPAYCSHLGCTRLGQPRLIPLSSWTPCRRLESIEDNQAALMKALESMRQETGGASPAMASQQSSEVQEQLGKLSEQYRQLAARCDCLQGDLGMLREQSAAAAHESMPQPAMHAAPINSFSQGTATVASKPRSLGQVGERLEVLELLCERMAHHMLVNGPGLVPPQ